MFSFLLLTTKKLIGTVISDVVTAEQGRSDAGSRHFGVLRQLGSLQERRAPEAVSLIAYSLAALFPTSFRCSLRVFRMCFNPSIDLNSSSASLECIPRAKNGVVFLLLGDILF